MDFSPHQLKKSTNDWKRQLSDCDGPSQTAAPRNSIAIYMPIGYNICMMRTALFLKEAQLKKLKVLSDKTGAPVAELIRRAIDKYLHERAKELK